MYQVTFYKGNTVLRSEIFRTNRPNIARKKFLLKHPLYKKFLKQKLFDCKIRIKNRY